RVRQARRRRGDFRDGERAVRLRGRQHLANRPSENERRAGTGENGAGHGGTVLVLRARVLSAAGAAADGESPSRTSARGARRAVSGGRRPARLLPAGFGGPSKGGC